MAYPEPIPALTTKKEVKEFEKRTKGFKLSESQKELYKRGLAQVRANQK